MVQDGAAAKDRLPCTVRVQFAAMVIDRFCLITFTAFTIITTIAVLLSAPHIIVA